MTTFLIVIFIIIIYLIFNKTSYVSANDLKEYCIKHSYCKSSSIYIKQIDNYYFCIDDDKNTKTSTNLAIFNEEHGDKKKLTYFGGSTNENTTANTYFSTYMSNFPDRKNKTVGDSTVFFSKNYCKIEKAVITIEENNTSKDKEFLINPNEPFVLKIDRLGIIDGIKKEIIDYHFYSENGNEIKPLIK